MTISILTNMKNIVENIFVGVLIATVCSLSVILIRNVLLGFARQKYVKTLKTIHNIRPYDNLSNTLCYMLTNQHIY